MSRSAWSIYRSPAGIAAAVSGGLISALVADGVWDWLSWLLLGAAVAAALFFSFRRPRAAARGDG